MYLFFDTETTGLPKDYHARIDDSDNWPRIIQLAWALYNEKEELIDSYCKLIKPDGWVIKKEKEMKDGTLQDNFWVQKGYSTEQNEIQGVPISEALLELIKQRKSHPFTIGHNLTFDRLIVRSEIFRLGITAEFKAKKICTMIESTKFCQILNKKGTGYKWPKLEELYKILFKEDLTGAHDALIDVKATAKCFFELKRLNQITL